MNEILLQPLLFWIGSFLATMGAAAGVPLVDDQREGGVTLQALVVVNDLPRSLAALRASPWSAALPADDTEIIAAMLAVTSLGDGVSSLADRERQRGLRRLQWSSDEAGRRLAFTLDDGIDGTGLAQADWFADGHVLGSVTSPALELEEADQTWDLQFALRLPRYQLPEAHQHMGGGLSLWSMVAAHTQLDRLDGALALAAPETRMEMRSQLPRGWPLKPIAAPILADIPRNAIALWIVGVDADQWWQTAGEGFMTKVNATLGQLYPEVGDAQAFATRLEDGVRRAGLGNSLAELMQALQFDLAMIFPAEANPLSPVPEIILHGSPTANAMIARIVAQHLGVNLDSGDHHQIPGLPLGSVYFVARRETAWMLTADSQRITSWLASENGGWAQQPEVAGWLESATSSGAWALLHAEPRFVTDYCAPALNNLALRIPNDPAKGVIAQLTGVLSGDDLGHSRMVLAPAKEGAHWQLSGQGPVVETLLASLVSGLYLSD